MLLVFHDAAALDFEEFTAVYRGSALENCGRMYPNEPEPSEALARYEREHRAYMGAPSSGRREACSLWRLGRGGTLPL